MNMRRDNVRRSGRPAADRRSTPACSERAAELDAGAGCGAVASDRAISGVRGRLAQSDSRQGNAAGAQELSVHDHVRAGAGGVLGRDDRRRGVYRAEHFLRGRRAARCCAGTTRSWRFRWWSSCRMRRFARWRRSAKTIRTTCCRSRRSSRGKSSAASWAARSCRWRVYFSAITPCLAFTYLLRGVDRADDRGAAGRTRFSGRSGLSMIGILLATLTRAAVRAGVRLGGVCGGLLLDVLLRSSVMRSGVIQYELRRVWGSAASSGSSLAAMATVYVTMFRAGVFRRGRNDHVHERESLDAAADLHAGAAGGVGRLDGVRLDSSTTIELEVVFVAGDVRRRCIGT